MTLLRHLIMNVSGSQRDDNWLLPVLNDACLDLRLFAVSADDISRRGRQALALGSGKRMTGPRGVKKVLEEI